MSEQPYPDPAVPVLAGLRRSRAERMTVTRRRARLVGVVAGAAWAVVAWRSAPRPGLHGMPLAIAVTIACFLAVVAALGKAGWGGPNGGAGLLALVTIYVVARSARRGQVQEEQEERLLAELEESRKAGLRAAALAERQRLAREMHDVLAHSLSGLVVQLEGTRLLAATAPGDDRLPAAIDRALLLARGGLGEAREAIGMLRGGELPGPGRLAELASEFTAHAGVPCQFTEAGTARGLAPAVRLALYRVTQEALTNVRRHASPDRVEVRLQYLPEAVTLTVQDFGSGRGGRGAGPSGGPAAGYGLTGMRERAGLLGGSLDASATQDGFRVLLRVPA